MRWFLLGRGSECPPPPPPGARGVGRRERWERWDGCAGKGEGRRGGGGTLRERRGQSPALRAGEVRVPQEPKTTEGLGF